MLARLKRRLRSRGDRGATAVEIGLLIAGVGIAAIGGLTALNSALSGSFQGSATSEGTCVGSGCDPYTWADNGIPVINAMVFSTGYSDVTAYRNQAIANQTPVVTGALGTKTYAVSPALPAGVSLNTSTGVLSGTPTATSASTTYTVTVTDSGGAPSITDIFTMSVTIAPMVFTTPYNDVAATRNQAITSQTPTVTGALGTRTYAISPALPAGLTFTTSSGRISGTPTANSPATTYTVTVTDSGGAPSATDSFILSVSDPALAFTTGYSDVTAIRNQAITSQTPTVTGALGTRTYAISPALPAGLTLRTTDGRLSGTPTAISPATTYTVTVTDSGGATSATDSFVLSVGYAPMTFTTGYSTINAVTNVAITTQTPTVTGAIGTRTFAISPALPAGLTFGTTDGRISGTPTATQSTTVHTVTVTDSGGAPSATANVSITVTQVRFTTGYADIDAFTGTAITSQTPSVTGGSGTDTFAISPALPAGLTFRTSDGRISGTPTATSALTTYTVTVTDTSGTATTTFTLEVNAPLSIDTGYSAISAKRNVAITSQTPTVSGGTTPYTFSISPALPAGLSFRTSDGRISGTPTATQAATTHTVTVTDNAGRTDTTTVSVSVTAIGFTGGYSSITAIRNVAITDQTPSTSNGSGTAVFSVSPALPTGLALRTSDGRISGTPTGAAQGATTYTVTVTDDTGSATDTFSIGITQISFSTGYSNITVNRNNAITNQTPTMTGGSGTDTFSISPSVPAGMSFRTSDGRISGTPTSSQAATTYTVTASDTSGTVTTTFTIRVN